MKYGNRLVYVKDSTMVLTSDTFTKHCFFFSLLY